MTSTEQNLEPLLKALCKIRSTPQLLFATGVDVNSFLRVKELVRNYRDADGDMTRLDFIVHSFGGSPDHGYRIIRYLRESFTEVNVIVPALAKSAATLMTLGGNNIYLGDCGELGPLDMQIGTPSEDSPSLDFESALTDDFSLRQIEERVVYQYSLLFNWIYSNHNIPINKIELSKQLFSFCSDFYQPLLEQINPYNMGKKVRILEIGKRYALKVFAQFNSQVSEEERTKFIDYLVNAFPSHGFSVDWYELKNYLSFVHRAKDVSPEFDILIDMLADFFFNLHHLDHNLVVLKPYQEGSLEDEGVTEHTTTEEGTDVIRTDVQELEDEQDADAKTDQQRVEDNI